MVRQEMIRHLQELSFCALRLFGTLVAKWESMQQLSVLALSPYKCLPVVKRPVADFL